MRHTLIQQVRPRQWRRVGYFDVEGEGVSVHTPDPWLREWVQEMLSQPLTVPEGVGGNGGDHGTRDRIVTSVEPGYLAAFQLNLPNGYAVLDLLPGVTLVDEPRAASA